MILLEQMKKVVGRGVCVVLLFILSSFFVSHVYAACGDHGQVACRRYPYLPPNIPQNQKCNNVLLSPVENAAGEYICVNPGEVPGSITGPVGCGEYQQPACKLNFGPNTSNNFGCRSGLVPSSVASGYVCLNPGESSSQLPPKDVTCGDYKLPACRPLFGGGNASNYTCYSEFVIKYVESARDYLCLHSDDDPSTLFSGQQISSHCTCSPIGVAQCDFGYKLSGLPVCARLGPSSATFCSCIIDPSCGGHGQIACKDTWGNQGCRPGQGTATVTKDGSTRCLTTEDATKNLAVFNLCVQTGEGRSECQACYDKHNGAAIWTAIGCIPTDRESIVLAFVRLAIGVSGGVVLLIILSAAFQIATSKGDPKAMEESQAMITNAIGGALFIIFSMVLVRSIGIDILKIPGF